jgi:hypothetical protein
LKIIKPLYYFFFTLFTTVFVGAEAHSQIEFIENKGQWNSEVKFKSNAGSGAFYLQEDGFTIAQNNPKDLENLKEKRHSEAMGIAVNNNLSNIIHAHAYNVKFLNSQEPTIIPDKASPTINNYFIGNDPSKWASNCRIFRGVIYKDVYPGIDVRYYSDAGSNLKYDFIIHPGADPNNIAMKYSGANKVSVIDKQLIVSTSLGDNKELSPYTYQVVNNNRQELDCRYTVNGDVVRFKVKNYDPQKVLIIDPTEIFFSYSGSIADNWGFTATYGPDGSFYGGGIVFDNGFPVSPGAYDNTFNGNFDIGIIKLSPDGKNRIYATYIGGNGLDQPHSLVVDPQGSLVIAGRSNSSDYPTFPASLPAVIGPGGGWDIIVTKLNATGSALIGSMRIGGTGDDGVNMRDDDGRGGIALKRNYGDDARSEVLLDASNNIFLASCTQSPDYNQTITAGAFQPAIGGLQDGVVLKITPNCDGIIWNTFLGGSGNDAAYVLALDQNDNVYVGGGTASTDLPGISPSGVISSANSGGDCDGFVVELNSTGTAAIKGTYLGTPGADQVYGIDEDKNGFVYVTGTTEGSWPVIKAPGENSIYSNSNSKQFISKLQPDLSSYVYSTVFGSGSTLPNISITAFLVDRYENVYVAGWGGKSNTGFFNTGSTIGMATTPNAIKPQTDVSGSDFYFIVLKKDADSLLYGTFFGQEDPPEGGNPVTFGDHVDGGTSRFDKNGVIYEALCANCFRTVAFPGSAGAWSPTDAATAGGECNLGMLKIAMNFSRVQASLKATIGGVPNDTIGPAPLLVNFSDTLHQGKLYYWSFGDGTGDTSTSANVSHTFTASGFYTVRLISIDSSTSNISDSAYIHINVVASNSLLSGLVSYWPLNEISGPAYDVTGGGNQGFSKNTTQGVAGKIKTAYSFNGSSSKVDMGNPANLSLTTAGTISCWVYMPVLPAHDGVILEKGDAVNGRNGYALFYQKQSNSFQFMIADSIHNALYSAGSGLSAATWYHVVCSWVNGSFGGHGFVYTYLNGNVISNTSSIYNCVSNVYNFALGGNLPTSSAYFQGIIDEVGVWNRALISSEVATLYNSGAGIPYPFAASGTNIPPIANAGQNQSLPVGTTSTTLNGSGTDADGTVTGFAWTQTSGRSATINSPTSASTTITGLSPGTYFFQLTVTDNLGATDSATVQVIVNPIPTSNAGPNQTLPVGTTSATLSGSGTGTGLTYQWTQNSGGSVTINSPASAKTKVSGLSVGTYTFLLTVTDNLNNTATSSVSVTVNSSLINGLISYWKLDEEWGFTLPQYAFDAAGGGNTGIINNSYSSGWQGKVNKAFFFDGTTWVNMGNPTNLNLTSAGTISVWVNASNINPAGHAVIVSKGNVSADTYGYTIELYNNGTFGWELANATSKNYGSFNGITPVANTWYHLVLTWDGAYVTTYINGGNQNIFPETVIPVSNVNDFVLGYLYATNAGYFSGTIDEVGVWNRALSSAEVATLYNSGTGNQFPFPGNGGAAPIASAGPNQLLSAGTNSTPISGSGKTISSGTSITSYSWTQTTGNNVTISSPSSATTTVTGLSSGSYTFQLTVTDNLGSTGSSTMHVFIYSGTSNTYNVTKTADDGSPGTLRWAVTNATSGSDTINITVPGTISLNSALPDIANSVTINGLGANVDTISGNYNFTAFNTNFVTKSSKGLAISGLTIAKCSGTIHLADDDTQFGGGAITTGVPLTLTNCTFFNNYGFNGPGAIFLFGGGQLNSTGCTFYNNQAGNGLYNLETAGGAIDGGGPGSITNCTFTGNSAPADGGAISWWGGNLTITNCTFVNNFSSEGAADVECYNCIISNSIIATPYTADHPDPDGSIISGGHNLIGDGASIWGSYIFPATSSDQVGTVANPIDPLVGPLSSNGGTTQTMALLPGSPAIDAGGNSCPTSTDQRGIPKSQGRACDIGAFESRGFTMSYASGNNQSNALGAPFANPLSVKVKSSYGELVDGGQITFNSPTSGVSCLISGNPATISGGIATTGTVTANAIIGSYNVNASANGAIPSVNFSLVNTSSSSLLNGLISYWPLDESAGLAIDTAGGGNNGFPTNTVQGVTGKINTAYLFNGSSSKVDMNNPANLSLTTAATVSCWIYMPALPSGDAVIFEKADAVKGLYGYAMFYQKQSNTFQFMVANGINHAAYSAGSGLSAATWYHIVCSWNGSTVTTYLNGSVVSSTSQIYNCVSNVYDFALGGNLPTNTAYFSGTIDEVGVWNRALISSEVATLFDSGSGNAYPFTTVTIPATGLNQNPALITNNSGASVRAYPNPYSTEINFYLKSSITGKGSLIIYDVLGRKLASVFEGDFMAGSEITVSYKMGVAQRQPLLYVFTIGDDIIHGKLLPGEY